MLFQYLFYLIFWKLLFIWLTARVTVIAYSAIYRKKSDLQQIMIWKILNFWKLSQKDIDF